MSRNGSGVYSLPVPPFTPGTVILSADVNSDFSDIATALTGSIAADGQTSITGQLRGSQASAPTYSISGDLNTGFGSSSADTAYIQCGGINTLACTVLGATITGTAAITGTLTVTGVTTLGNITLGNVLTPLTVLSTDAGATAEPVLDLYRNSATPAVSDLIGTIDFNGRDSAANKQLYARIFSQITDPVSTTEDAILTLQTVVAGTLTSILLSSGANITIPGNLTVTGNIAGPSTTPTVQRFTSGTAQTYTAPAGVVRQRVRIVGPGGGGGGATANAGSNSTANTSFQVNATGTAWVANLGVGGSAAGGSAGSGGTGGSDGSTGTLVVRIQGGNGCAGGSTSTGGTIQVSGAGGGTPFGSGSGAQQGTPAAPPANTGIGGGGGGGNSATAAGSGGGGGEYVEFWVTGMTTATYTIGPGGAAGIAGTNAGRAGAAGIIIVEEFYA